MLFARCASSWPHLATLPGPASAVLALSPGDGCCFRLFVKIYQASFRTYGYIPISVVQQVGIRPKELRVHGSNPGWCFFSCVPFSLFAGVGATCFVTSTKTCTMMTKVLSEQTRSQFYMHTECCGRRCCCSVCCYTAVVAAAAVLVLPAAVRHRVPGG